MDSRLVDFLSFLNDIGISVDDASVRFVRSEIHGFGVIALRNITPRQVLATIPKSAILSVQTASLWQESDLTDHCPERNLELKYLSKDQWCCPPIFQLAAATLFETFLGDRSPWHRYLNVLPTTLGDVGVPLAESEENIRIVAQGTGIDVLTAQMHKSLRSAFDEVRELFVIRAQKLGIGSSEAASVTYEQFALSFAWVTSRAFHVDSFHGNSLVPVADMFNHSTDGEHVHIEGVGGDESDGEDDDIVDEEDACNREDIEYTDIAKNSRAGHGGNYTARQGSKEADDDLRIVCVKGATAGEELFNTFGQKCNTVLYLNYGFTQRANAYDTAFIHKSDVESVLKRFIENIADGELKMTPQRQACIHTASIIIFDDVVDNFFQISADSFCHGLLVLIFLHVVPWRTLAPVCNDEFELLEYLMQLSMDDMMQAGYSQIVHIISEIAIAQLQKFPAGTHVPFDRATLAEAKDLSPLKTHILRIRIGQRIAMEKAMKKLLNSASSETKSQNLKLTRSGTETTEPEKKRFRKS